MSEDKQKPRSEAPPPPVNMVKPGATAEEVARALLRRVKPFKRKK